MFLFLEQSYWAQIVRCIHYIAKSFSFKFTCPTRGQVQPCTALPFDPFLYSDAHINSIALSAPLVNEETTQT